MATCSPSSASANRASTRTCRRPSASRRKTSRRGRAGCSRAQTVLARRWYARRRTRCMAATLRLRVIGADRNVRTVELPKAEATLGAVPGNDVVLDEARVSSRHATLRLGSHGLELRDSSTNGTFVRGQRVQSAWLVQG